MKGAHHVAVIAVFTAMVVGSDLVLSGPEFSNIKLMDTLVFVAAYVFGFRVGAAVGVLSESIWSVVSPIGMAGAITPFLVGGEVLFAFAGWGASKLWESKPKVISMNSVYIGALLALCAFVWDLETNAATALIAYWPALTAPKLLAMTFGPLPLLFALAHEGSDFALGSLLGPSFIRLVPKALGRRP